MRSRPHLSPALSPRKRAERVTGLEAKQLQTHQAPSPACWRGRGVRLVFILVANLVFQFLGQQQLRAADDDLVAGLEATGVEPAAVEFF